MLELTPGITMSSQTDNRNPESSLPASWLELLHAPIQDEHDIWRQRFKALIEQLPIMLYTSAPHDLGQIEYTSSNFALWLGYTEDDWTATTEMFASLIHPEDLGAVMASDARAVETSQPFEIEYRLRAKDGSWHWVRDHGVLLRNQNDVGIAWQGVTVDITGLKEAEMRQAEARLLYRSLIEQVPGVVFRESTALPPEPLYVSPQVEELLGYTAAEWKAMPSAWDAIVHPGDRTRVQQAHLDAVLNTVIHIQYRMITKDGSVIWVREDRELVVDDSKRPSCWQGLLMDITRQKRLEEQLAYQAQHDPLTDLPNRNYFNELVTDALSGETGNLERIALLFLDLDGFKSINDGLGHHIGDALLARVGLHLSDALRDDDVIARLGGDEFAILLSHPIDEDGAAAIADRALKALRHRFVIDGQEIRCSGSIGIAFGAPGDDSLADLLRQADIAMYRAKALGKDRYAMFEPDTGYGIDSP